jgi:hypothetical protein
MAIFWTLFESGFQMVQLAILFPKPNKFVRFLKGKTSQDRFIKKESFLMPKWSRLANQFFSHLVFAIRKPDRSASGQKRPFKNRNGPVFGC